MGRIVEEIMDENFPNLMKMLIYTGKYNPNRINSKSSIP